MKNDNISSFKKQIIKLNKNSNISPINKRNKNTDMKYVDNQSPKRLNKPNVNKSPNLPQVKSTYDENTINEENKNNILLNKKDLVNEESDNLRISRKFTHDKNLEFIKKLAVKIDIIKINPIKYSTNAFRNSVEKFKIIKEYYGKNEKKKNDTYYYSISTGNNSELIKKCMLHRENWKENNGSDFNFRWQPTSNRLDYSLFVKNNFPTRVIKFNLDR